MPTPTEFSIGDKVSLILPISYLKTADPMPMLRPPDLVAEDEIGEVVGLAPMGNFQVRFRRGVFLIPKEKISKSDIDDPNK